MAMQSGLQAYRPEASLSPGRSKPGRRMPAARHPTSLRSAAGTCTLASDQQHQTSPMRELILLRHAHAEAPIAGMDDRQRPLSATGLAEARAAGEWLRAHGLRPDRVLCSPATRTRQTLQALGDLGCTDLREEEAIYAASPGVLIALADAHADARRLLLVGHNPGLEQLAALLHSGQSGDYRGMPPAGIAVLTFPLEAAIEPGTARLSRFWWP